MIEQQDHIDFSTIPVSKGLSRSTLMIVITGVLMIFVFGGLSVFWAGYGHRWPSAHTMRMDLGSMPTTIQ